VTALGLAYMRPTPEERDEINRIIMEELVCGVFKAEAVAYFQRAYARMKDAGCDAVVLGCTEIPADHERRQLAAADARLDPAARPRGAAARRGPVTDD
jgi:aspartate/glutamate racemase